MIQPNSALKAYEPSQNGSFPLWTYGSTILARRGDDLYLSATETIPDAEPLNCVRWALMKRTPKGWVVLQRDPGERTREPAPIALDANDVIMSVNPTLVLGKRSGLAKPLLLAFSLTAPEASPRVLKPPWTTEPKFSEHSYRGMGCDPDTGALLLMNVEAYRGQHWVYRNAGREWANSGVVEFPAIDSYKGPIPIRFLYPGVALRNGAAHVITKGGVEDFVKERVEYRKSKKSKVWGRYHIGYCWSPDVANEPLSPWIYAVDVSENAGEVWNCDLWVAPNGDCHILWREKDLDERLRPKYFSDRKQVRALKHGIMRDGKRIFSQTLLRSVEGVKTNRPEWGRFHATEDGRLFVFTTERAAPGGTVNRLIEIRGDRTVSDPVAVPLIHAFTMLSMTAAPYGGTQPAHTIEIVGRGNGLPGTTIRYAKIRLVPADTPELRIEGKVRLEPGDGRMFELRAVLSPAVSDKITVRWTLPDGVHTGDTLSCRAPSQGVRMSVSARAEWGDRGFSVAHAQLHAPPEGLGDLGEHVVVEAEAFVAQGEGEIKVYAPESVRGSAITYWHKDIGHWLEWDVNLPSTGRYAVFARYATGSHDTQRDFRIDGKLPSEEHGCIRFPHTGGWSGSASVWDFRQLGSALELTAGRHRFRMANLKDGLGVDYFIFKRLP
ncbi:MAG: carbohydrate-binding protein [Lentisphaerae bacterium]|nr:carbohydrate-binding protein [Lentisphaerota bacterium]MBT4818153.1 carbohydrate-binding protein [Lentisphaerota bacterium]MBT5610263.1 carbohydrate-binding protein [Lentisphaerota bacterium]MBT7843967.1 carbohydrate-binding protein [Lentisphaerota bacterium]